MSVDVSKALFEQLEHKSKMCHPDLNECRSMWLSCEIGLHCRPDAILMMLYVLSSP